MLCGKIAAGKSTLASRLASRTGTVLIAEDDWLHALFADNMHTPADYVRYATKQRDIMGPHIVSLLKTDITVVLDFQANTRESRTWMRGIIESADALHQLHVLDVSDALCLARLRERNASGEHPFAASEEQFRRVTRHYEAPTPAEGFNLVLHQQPT